MTPVSGLATASMPFGSMYSCSCAPVSNSPSTISAAPPQAAATSPRDTVYDLNTLSLPQTTRSAASELSIENTPGCAATRT